MQYINNIGLTISRANRYSQKYGDAHAWNNKKRKNTLRYAPRGKIYKRLCAQRRLNVTEGALSALEGGLSVIPKAI